MMRAIGTSRRQVRSIVRQESVITSMIGAVLGVVLGVLFALLISRPLADEGFTLTFPIGTLILLLVLAALFGVLAAIGPARRAARLDVLARAGVRVARSWLSSGRFGAAHRQHPCEARRGHAVRRAASSSSSYSYGLDPGS